MDASELLMSLPVGVRQPLGSALVRLPWPGAKLVGFLASPAVRAEPWALYRELREREPIFKTPFGATVLSRHVDATEVLRNKSTSVDESKLSLSNRLNVTDRDGAFATLTGQTMLFTDPPDHERLRRLVNKAFTPNRVRDLQPHVERLVERRVSLFASQGEVDVLADIAYPLPVQVICELLGLPADVHSQLIVWARSLAARLDIQPVRSPAVERNGDMAAEALTSYLGATLDDPTRRVAGGLMDGLLESEDDGQRLTREEIIAMCALTLIAGFETTANLVGNGLLALLKSPVQMEMLRTGQIDMGTATEELLRFDGPVQLTQRVLLEDLDIGGVLVSSGDLVVILNSAANRDPQVFRDPDQLDLGRRPNPHVAFSTGIHACLGAALARMEAGALIGHLLERFPALRLAQEPDWRDSFVLRGLKSLPLSWS